jgi:maltose 6'-phosphate phosphatase
LIGNRAGGARTFDGLIDNVRIYDSVENAASLTSIMQFDDTDLVFQMDFNDVDGDQSLVDRGTTGATGTFSGGANYSTTVAPSNSGGYSGSFDGSSGGADFGDINTLDGLTNMTLTAWVRPSTLNPGGPIGSARILSKRSGSGPELYYHDDDDELEFVIDGTGGNTVFNGGGSFSGQQWTFVAVTWSGTTATFYTGDGTTLSAGDADTGAAQTLGATTANLVIGNNNAGNRTFDGLIDNVRIYKTVKDAASLQTIMQYNDAANSTPNPRVTLSTAADLVDSAYTVDVTFSSDVSGLEASDFGVTNGTASGVSPATGPASTYTVTITPTNLVPATVTVQLPANSVSDGDGLSNRVSNILSTLVVAPEGPKQSITVRVAAYNVEFGKSATPEQIGALLLPYNLDIIGFNEVPDGDWTDRVGAVVGMDYSFVGQISSANHVDKYKSILSRTPLEVTSEFQLTGAGWNPASAVRATTKIDGNTVAFYSLHISASGTTGSHSYQLATQVLPLETADRVIVVGDFNNEIGDFNINSIEDAGFEAIWTDLNIDVTQEKTYDAQDPGTSHGVIDHIFFNTSASPKATDGGIIEEVSPLSDHKPIWAEIAFTVDGTVFIFK